MCMQRKSINFPSILDNLVNNYSDNFEDFAVEIFNTAEESLKTDIDHSEEASADESSVILQDLKATQTYAEHQKQFNAAIDSLVVAATAQLEGVILPADGDETKANFKLLEQYEDAIRNWQPAQQNETADKVAVVQKALLSHLSLKANIQRQRHIEEGSSVYLRQLEESLLEQLEEKHGVFLKSLFDREHKFDKNIQELFATYRSFNKNGVFIGTSSVPQTHAEKMSCIYQLRFLETSGFNPDKASPTQLAAYESLGFRIADMRLFKQILKNDHVLKTTFEKCDVMKAMHDVISLTDAQKQEQNPEKQNAMLENKLQVCKDLYTKKHAVLAKHRDSNFMTFAKVMATILSVAAMPIVGVWSLIAISSIWSVKGEKVGQEIASHFHKDVPARRLGK